MTRQLAVQTGGAALRIAINDLSRSLAVELDRSALNGSGAGAEPEGILLNTDIPTVALGANGGAPTRAMAIAEKTLSDDGADAGQLAWFSTPAARAKIRTVERSSGSGRYLWSDEDTILSHPARATGNLPENLSKGSGSNLSALVFGNWADLAVGTLGCIDILVDRFTFASSGGYRIVAFWDVDIHPRDVVSFVKVVDMVTT